MKIIFPGLVWLVFGVGLGVIQYSGDFGWWVLGMILAGLLVLADRWLYLWWLKPFEQLSIQFQYWWQRHEFLAAGRLLIERRAEQTKLVLSSLGFACLWPLLTIYVLTSTGSVTAAGIVMALGFRLAWAVVADWRQPTILSRWFCWQIKRSVSLLELRVMAGAYLTSWVLVVGLWLLK